MESSVDLYLTNARRDQVQFTRLNNSLFLYMPMTLFCIAWVDTTFQKYVDKLSLVVDLWKIDAIKSLHGDLLKTFRFCKKVVQYVDSFTFLKITLHPLYSHSKYILSKKTWTLVVAAAIKDLNTFIVPTALACFDLEEALCVALKYR